MCSVLAKICDINTTFGFHEILLNKEASIYKRQSSKTILNFGFLRCVSSLATYHASK